LDHAAVSESDLEWMAPVESLTLWNVRLPERALARLPNLSGVSLRGGSSEDLHALNGCDSLQWLDVNQVRGLRDLDALGDLTNLEFLSLYGLPRISVIPSLGAHRALRQVQLGSMKGLTSLAGVTDAPVLTTLFLKGNVNVTDDDLDCLAGHPALRAFDWFWGDVPQRIALPVLDRLAHLAKPTPIRAEEWPRRRMEADGDIQ
jgi:Leucine-rich repeat (LRR) protein